MMMMMTMTMTMTMISGNNFVIHIHISGYMFIHIYRHKKAYSTPRYIQGYLATFIAIASVVWSKTALCRCKLIDEGDILDPSKQVRVFANHLQIGKRRI